MAGQEAAFARDIQRLQARRTEFVRVNCPACGSDQSSRAFEKFNFSYRWCVDCQTLYMSPRPSAKVMEDYYTNSENYRYWAEHIFPASEAARREKIHRPWLRRIVEICQRHGVVRGHLVEIGPGFGTFAALVTSEGAFSHVTAIEPTPEMAAACRSKGVNVIQSSVEKVDQKMPAANVVVAFEVLEHLFDPLELFQQASRLLATEGILVVSCPNSLGFDVATLGAESLAVDAEHVNLLNPTSIGKLGQRCALKCLEVSTPGRLDAEFVRTAALKGRCDLSSQPFLRKVLLEDWDLLGNKFQHFLSENGLSAHMWAVFQKSN
jgi:SAM-dependent methyltransferase